MDHLAGEGIVHFVAQSVANMFGDTCNVAKFFLGIRGIAGLDGLVVHWLPKGEAQGQKLLVQPQDIRAFDKDAGLSSPVFYTFNSKANEYKYFDLNRNTGHIYIKSNIPDNEFLQPRTLVVKATQFDNPDRYAVTTLTVTRGGIFDSDLQFLQTNYAVEVLENEPLNNVVATLITNRPSDKRVHFRIREKTLPNEEFSVNDKGHVVLRKKLVLNFSQINRLNEP